MLAVPTMRIQLSSLVLLAVAYVCVFPLVSSVSFMLGQDERKCVREEVHKDVLVIGNYQLSDHPGVRTDIVVCFH